MTGVHRGARWGQGSRGVCHPGYWGAVRAEAELVRNVPAVGWEEDLVGREGGALASQVKEGMEASVERRPR